MKVACLSPARPLPLQTPLPTARRQSVATWARLPGLMVALALVLSSASAALACGGGGSGSYRKPPRPGQHQHNSALNSQALSAPGESKNSERN